MQSLQLPVIHSHCLGGIQRTWSHPSAGPCSRPIIVPNYHLPWHSWEAARGENTPPAVFVSACLSHLAPKASGKRLPCRDFAPASKQLLQSQGVETLPLQSPSRRHTRAQTSSSADGDLYLRKNIFLSVIFQWEARRRWSQLSKKQGLRWFTRQAGIHNKSCSGLDRAKKLVGTSNTSSPGKAFSEDCLENWAVLQGIIIQQSSFPEKNWQGAGKTAKSSSNLTGIAWSRWMFTKRRAFPDF